MQSRQTTEHVLPIHRIPVPSAIPLEKEECRCWRKFRPSDETGLVMVEQIVPPIHLKRRVVVERVVDLQVSGSIETDQKSSRPRRLEDTLEFADFVLLHHVVDPRRSVQLLRTIGPGHRKDLPQSQEPQHST